MGGKLPLSERTLPFRDFLRHPTPRQRSEDIEPILVSLLLGHTAQSRYVRPVLRTHTGSSIELAVALYQTRGSLAGRCLALAAELVRKGTDALIIVGVSRRYLVAGRATHQGAGNKRNT